MKNDRQPNVESLTDEERGSFDRYFAAAIGYTSSRYASNIMVKEAFEIDLEMVRERKRRIVSV